MRSARMVSVEADIFELSPLRSTRCRLTTVRRWRPTPIDLHLLLLGRYPFSLSPCLGEYDRAALFAALPLPAAPAFQRPAFAFFHRSLHVPGSAPRVACHCTLLMRVLETSTVACSASAARR